MAKKILVVDDSVASLRLTREVLEQGGYSAVVISDPGAIERTIESERPSAILLDVVMPNRNGFQACRDLKNHPEYARIPVILVTTKSTTSDRYWGELQGADGYVVKPFTSEELLEAVGKVL